MRYLSDGIGEAEPLDRVRGQDRRVFVVAPHPGTGRGKTAKGVEAVGVERFVRAWRRRRKARPSPTYLGPRHHPLEEEAGAPVSKCVLGETHKGVMHFMLRDRDGQAVQICSDHSYAPVRPHAPTAFRA